jgi:hypothetical protein
MSFMQPFFVVRKDDIIQAIENSHYENNEVLIIQKNQINRGIFCLGNEIDLTNWEIKFPARMSLREAGIFTNSNILSKSKVFGEENWLFALREYHPSDWPYLKNDTDDYNYSWQKIHYDHLFGISIEKNQGLELIIWVNF